MTALNEIFEEAKAVRKIKLCADRMYGWNDVIL